MQESMGKRIARLRREQGLTQEALAERMGVSAQAVSKWENEIACPDISMLPALADLFCISVDELLRGGKPELVRMQSELERKNVDKMFLRVVVNSRNGDNVRVNLPVPLVRAALEIGLQLPQVGGQELLEHIDFEAIVMAVDRGVVGKIVEVESQNGDTVDVFVE